jgi:peptide/nickel transport system substrate-binding protein
MKRLGATVFLSMLLLLAAGCGQTASGRSPAASGGTLRVALVSDAVTLDPPMFTDVYSGYVSSQINEPLFSVDFDQQIVPWLAERLDQPDPATYLVKLRRGVKFHNGEELTADDVKFTFDRVMDPATKSPRAWRLTDAIESPDKIQVVDRYTIKLNLKEPFAPFLERLTLASNFIVNRKAVETAGGEYARQPVGTGPFRLVEWRASEHVILERNPGYWGQQPSLDRLVFRPIADGHTRLAELESGGADHLVSLPSEEIARLKAEGKVQVMTEETISVFYLAFNIQKAPLTSAPLRQAISYAIDRDEMLAKLYDGVGQLAVSGLNPSSWAFNQNVERYAYNPGQARERLQANGGPPVEPLELAFNQSPELTRIAERLQAQMKENIGLKVSLKPMEFGALLNYIKTGKEHDMFLLSWSGTVDPDGVLFPLFHSKNFGAAGNRTFYKNERVDQLLGAAQRTIDQSERRQLYAEAQELIARDAPWLPIRHSVVSAALRPNVRGFRLHPLGNQIYTNVSL